MGTTEVPPRKLSTPRAAGVSGVIFSVLMMAGLAIIRWAIPADAAHPGAWVTDPSSRNAVRVALNLVPFAGLAFIWFMGVFRDRVGSFEDRFFVTVFLGSGFLFVACLFGAAAMAGSVVEMVSRNTHLSNPDTYYFGRWATNILLNVFGIKMAGMFIFSTSTIALRTAILPRWIAFTGFACGLVLLLIITHWLWIALLFPLWTLLLSTEFLIVAFRKTTDEIRGSSFRRLHLDPKID